MDRISWYSTSEESFEEYQKRIEKEMIAIQSEGFTYLQEWQMGYHVPNRIKLPDGRILDESELTAALKENSEDPILKKASRLLDIYFAEGFEKERFSHFSFLDDKDERKAREKYSSQQST